MTVKVNEVKRIPMKVAQALDEIINFFTNIGADKDGKESLLKRGYYYLTRLRKTPSHLMHVEAKTACEYIEKQHSPALFFGELLVNGYQGVYTQTEINEMHLREAIKLLKERQKAAEEIHRVYRVSTDAPFPTGYRLVANAIKHLEAISFEEKE